MRIPGFCEVYCCYITHLFEYLVDEQDEVSIKQVAELIGKSLNFGKELEYDTTKADGQFKKTASNAKLRKYLPDFQFTPLTTAIQESVNWFVENYAAARK